MRLGSRERLLTAWVAGRRRLWGPRPESCDLGPRAEERRSRRRWTSPGRMVTVRTERAPSSDAGRQRQTQGDLGTQSHGTRFAESAGLPKPRRVRCAADRHRGVVSGHGQCRAPPRGCHVHCLRRDRVVPQLSTDRQRPVTRSMGVASAAPVSFVPEPVGDRGRRSWARPLTASSCHRGAGGSPGRISERQEHAAEPRCPTSRSQ